MSSPKDKGSTKRHTIGRIIDTAKHEFAHRGYASARMDEIAKAAGVTKQAIYQYYASKDELLAAVLYQTADELFSEWGAVDFEGMPPPVALRTYLHHLLDQYQRNRYLAGLTVEGLRLSHEQASPQLRYAELAPVLIERMSRILASGVQSGDFKSVDARFFLTTATLLITGVFSSPYPMTVMLGVDVNTAEGELAWCEYILKFLMNSILVTPEE